EEMFNPINPFGIRNGVDPSLKRKAWMEEANGNTSMFTKQENGESNICKDDGFQDIMHRGWSGMGQAQLIRVPMAHRINAYNIFLNGNDSIGTNQRKRSRDYKLNKAFISSAISLEEKNAIKDELHQALWSGDRNTSYFHEITKAKRIRNTISSVRDD
ncbi:LOW QUALITY PROTEIN: hypothetical protein HID58_075197, partial [Brassica napus]